MSFFFSQEMFVYFIAVFQYLCIYKENNLFSDISYMISGTFQLTDNGAEFQASQEIIGMCFQIFCKHGRGSRIDFVQEIVFTEYIEG